MQRIKRVDTRKIVLLAILTAIVIILQLLGAFIKFGPFSVTLVLMPIVIGAALMGELAGVWLGIVFGFVVLVSGDAAPFFAITPIGTILTVMIKGAVAGLVAGFTYRVISSINKTVGAVAAAIVCPIINTGTFIIGSYIFFLETLQGWGWDAGYINVTTYIFAGMIGVNFFFELGLNVILCPVIIRLIQYGQKTAIKAE